MTRGDSFGARALAVVFLIGNQSSKCVKCARVRARRVINSTTKGSRALPPRAHNDASDRTRRDSLGSPADASRRRRDRGVRAKTRGRARRPMPLRGHGRAFSERHPPPLPSSSAASPSRLPRTTHAHPTSLPDLPLQAYRVFHGVSEGVPGVTIDKYGDTLFVQSWRKPIVRAPR